MTAVPTGHARTLAAVSPAALSHLCTILEFPVRAVVVAGHHVPERLSLDDLLFRPRDCGVESVVIPIRGTGLDHALEDRNLDAMLKAGVILVLAFERKSEAIKLGYRTDTGGEA